MENNIKFVFGTRAKIRNLLENIKDPFAALYLAGVHV